MRIDVDINNNKKKSDMTEDEPLGEGAVTHGEPTRGETTGGVTASYAMLGDIQIAEPGALIGFAGPRVIEQTIRETLPQGFQRSEYLLEHGMLDMVVHRHQLRETLGRIVDLLQKLGVTSRTQAVVRGRALGLLPV